MLAELEKMNQKFQWQNCLTVKRQFPANLTEHQTAHQPVTPPPNHYVENILRDTKEMKKMQAAAEQRDQYARTIEKVHTVQDRGRMRHM